MFMVNLIILFFEMVKAFSLLLEGLSRLPLFRESITEHLAESDDSRAFLSLNIVCHGRFGKVFDHLF